MERQQATYPQAIARLEQIVQQIDAEEADVDALVASVQEAAGIIKTCRRRLRCAQGEIEAALQEIETDP